jgi:hypothetical protein
LAFDVQGLVGLIVGWFVSWLGWLFCWFVWVDGGLDSWMGWPVDWLGGGMFGQ